ncbi:chorismate synthase [Treponema sp. OttesenSCG-928-L16]|nr:chorismate synthase [Treponema sp. OttesenSCG-928-L16]
MAGNSFGSLFRVTSFGESHGPALGCIVDGCPAGLSLDAGDIAAELARRRPGGGVAGSARSEADEPEILSGVFNGKTLGTPITILIRNRAMRPSDYDQLKDVYRPGHADWTWEAKYGIRDYRGGGRSSGRETAGRVAAGAVAKKFLSFKGIEIRAWTSRAAGVAAPKPGTGDFSFDEIEQNPMRMPCRRSAEAAAAKIEELRKRGDSAGGMVSCRVTGLPPGLGEPVFDKLDARLAAAMLSIGAVKGIEFGAGFASADMTGSEHNDQPVLPGPDRGMEGGSSAPLPLISFKTNHAGGVLGGLSTGMPLEFRAAFKPVPSILMNQRTINRLGEECLLSIEGRHDACICPRAVPVVEAMAALVLADLMLLAESSRL